MIKYAVNKARLRYLFEELIEWSKLAHSLRGCYVQGPRGCLPPGIPYEDCGVCPWAHWRRGDPSPFGG